MALLKVVSTLEVLTVIISYNFRAKEVLVLWNYESKHSSKIIFSFIQVSAIGGLHPSEYFYWWKDFCSWSVPFLPPHHLLLLSHCLFPDGSPEEEYLQEQHLEFQ